MKNVERLEVEFTEDEVAQLQRLANESGLSISDVIRTRVFGLEPLFIADPEDEKSGHRN